MSKVFPIKILHVITDLGIGGAEMVLTRLLSQLDPAIFALRVLSLSDDQPLGADIRALGIPVTALGFRPGVPDVRMVTCLARMIKDWDPHLIQTWMYHSDLVGSLAARLAGGVDVVWGIHHTVASRRALKPSTRLVAVLNAWLSHHLPARIVCCAEAARLSHIRFGYDASRMVVIPNGCDTKVFRPDTAARTAVRKELGLRADVLLVGLCARFDPVKDHRTFLQAARQVQIGLPDVHFVLWGKGIDPGNQALAALIGAAGLEDRTHCLGPRSDSNRLFAAQDIAVLSSFTEAFPMVIAEAMACGVPFVATDAGDARLIIAETGRVVPIRDPQTLADAMLDLLQDPASRHSLGLLARQRIVKHYSLEKMGSEYADLYRDIIAGGCL